MFHIFGSTEQKNDNTLTTSSELVQVVLLWQLLWGSHRRDASSCIRDNIISLAQFNAALLKSPSLLKIGKKQIWEKAKPHVFSIGCQLKNNFVIGKRFRIRFKIEVRFMDTLKENDINGLKLIMDA